MKQLKRIKENNIKNNEYLTFNSLVLEKQSKRPLVSQMDLSLWPQVLFSFKINNNLICLNMYLISPFFISNVTLFKYESKTFKKH